MKKILAVIVFLFAASTAQAANVNIDALPAASSVAGTDLFECEQGGTNRRCTAAQSAAYTFGLFSGDATAAAGGAVTFSTVNSNVGTFGSSSQCATITVNAKGLVTAASQTACAGGGGTPGGSTTQLQYNNAGAFAGITGATTNGTVVTLTSPVFNTAVTFSFITGSTQCLQVNSSGVISGTGSVCGGSGSTGANPTATAGPTAVNGVATTFMRSDGAPAVQTATTGQRGLVQPDGTTITISSGVISAAQALAIPSTQTGTNYAFQASDQAKVIYLSNGSNQVPTIASAASLPAASGWFTTACNIAAGIQTITPTTSTIGGAASYALPGGSAAAPVCVNIISDGTNYLIVPQVTTNASLLSSGTVAAARGGAGTINGALKGNGSGVVSQAACADLSNGATGCSTAVGTSGATLPLLDGNNTWGGTQTFGSVVGTVSTQSGTTYTLAAGDCGTLVRFSNAAAVTVTIPQGLAIGCNIAIMQTSTGQVSVNGSAVTPATLQSAHSYTKTFGAGAIIGITIDATNHATLTGDGAT